MANHKTRTIITAALLACGARRVSGDLWLDYLLSLVLERPHAFAVMAANGRMDEAERIAMRADLAILGELATLDGAHLYRMAAERHRELQLKPRHAKDNISLLSSAVWAGGSIRPAPAANAKKFAAKNNAAGSLPIFNIKNIILQIWECFQDKIKARTLSTTQKIF